MYYQKARVFHHNGTEYLPETIDFLLGQRYLGTQMRKAGKRTKGPKPFTKEDRQQFKQVLEQELKDDPAVTIIEETAGSFIFRKRS